MSVARLIHVESMEGREPPLLLLAQLRDIDPTAELVYFGVWVDEVNETPVPDADGRGITMRPEREQRHAPMQRWRLGTIRRTDERQRRGQAILAMEGRRAVTNPRNVLLGKLLLQGFAQIEEYLGNDPFGVMLVNPGVDEYYTTIVDDFRARDAAWRSERGEQVFEERLAASSDDARQAEGAATMKQYLATDARDHFRREMRGRVMSGAAGVTGGRGKLILPPGLGG